jgi:hypothetical protein
MIENPYGKEQITMLSKTITSSGPLTDIELMNEFKALFKTPEARTRSIVYFIMSIEPIPRLFGTTNILYMGQTQNDIFDRYHRYSGHLASNSTGEFYKHIIKNYGGLKMGFIETETPKATEKEYFKKFFKTHKDYPPKSRVG